MLFHSHLLIIPLFLTALSSWGLEEAKSPTPKTEMVPMRDGTELATDVYLPSEGEGPWPVVLARTPYDKKNEGGLSNLVEKGVAVVVQDVRGRFASKGHARPFADDGWGKNRDGYDTVDWLRKQTWCNGKIATWGGSAGGITQVLLAASGAKGIVGQLIIVPPMSNYHGVFYQGGVFRKSLVEGWLKAAGWPPENLDEIRSHPSYFTLAPDGSLKVDEYWQTQSLADRVNQVDWPTVWVTGWYDIFLQGTIDAFNAIRRNGGPNGRDNIYLLIGPWAHGVNSTKVGEFEYPDSAKIPKEWPERDEWLLHWLKDAPLEPQPARITYYIMGEMPFGSGPGNEWRMADTLPSTSDPTEFYLAPDNKLLDAAPQSAQAQFVYDPSDPVPTKGGQELILPAGSFDQQDVENRSDVLLFDTEPMSEATEITGRIQVFLRVSTNAIDTDFTAKLTDVYPDGRSMLISDGIQRLSYYVVQHGQYTIPLKYISNEPEEGKRSNVEIDLGSTSIIINKGHRIRLAISSSNSPRFEPNPNTGDTNWKNPKISKATQTVYYGRSMLILPILSGDVTAE